MLEFNAFAVKGSKNELYPSQKTIAVAVGLPYITVRRAIDRMVEEKVLVQTVGSNQAVKTGNGWEMRRPATYQVDESMLVMRETVKEYTHRRYSKKRAQSVQQMPAPAESPASPVVPTSAAACRASSNPRTLRQLNRRERNVFMEAVARILDLKHDRSAPADPFFDLAPEPADDPWKPIRKRLEEQVDPHSFSTWLRPARYSHEKDGVLFLRVPSKDFLAAEFKYAALIKTAVRDLRLEISDVKFEPPPSVPAIPKSSAGLRAAIEQACKETLIPLESAIEALKLAGWNVTEEADSP